MRTPGGLLKENFSKITSFQTYSEQSGNMNKDSPMNLFQRNNRTSTQSWMSKDIYYSMYTSQKCNQSKCQENALVKKALW